MQEINYDDVKIKIKQNINKIFENNDKNILTTYEKRKKIYEYLVTNGKYNFQLFEQIKQNDLGKCRLVRNLQKEFEDALNGYGICNGFAQIYKLYLEEIGVFSYCIICAVKDEESIVGHQLNLVYDNETKSYSFDDITYGIIRNTTEQYFDYDLDVANNTIELQGIYPVSEDKTWIILPEDFVDYVAKRENSQLTKPLEETNVNITKNSDFYLYNIRFNSKKSLDEGKKVL